MVEISVNVTSIVLKTSQNDKKETLQTIKEHESEKI